MTQPENDTPPTFSQKLEKGKTYSMIAADGTEACIMSMETWLNYGNLVESQRRTMAAQNTRIKELLATNAGLVAETDAAHSRLENLRAVRRAEMRPVIEGELILPGSSNFTKPKGK